MKSKFGTVLLSLAIAFVLWAYVMTNISVEETITIHNVPVVTQNEGALEQRQLMLTAGMEQTVTLTLTGNRSELYKLSSNNVSVIVDLSRIYDPGRQDVGYTVAYPANVNTNSIEYQADKVRIPLTVEHRITRELDVVVEYQNALVEGYRKDDETRQLSHSTISVTGPASVVEKMTQARITVDLAGRKTAIDEDFDFVLCDAQGEAVEVPNVNHVITNAEYVHLNVLVQRYREIKLEVEVMPGGGATLDTSKLEFDPQTITVAGSDDAIAALEATLKNRDTLVLGTVDLAQYQKDTVLEFPVQLPAGITNLSECEVVKVKLTFPDLAIKTLTIPNDNLKAINVPQGLIAKVWTEQLKVTLRGPKTLITNLFAKDINVTVDFRGVLIGQTTLQPIVTLSEEFQDVGVLSFGNVTVTLEAPAPEPEPTEGGTPQSESESTEKAQTGGNG